MIVLAGFMGTGKTTVGRLIARRLSVPYVDTDALIEEKAGRSIPDLFKEKGEKVFRRMEKEAIRGAVRRERAVVAVGGGALLDPVNVKRLRGAGPLVCLTATPRTLLARLGKGAGRPLLAPKSPGESRSARLRSLLRSRAAAYAQADFEVKTDGLKPSEVAGRILKRLEPLD